MRMVLIKSIKTYFMTTSMVRLRKLKWVLHSVVNYKFLMVFHKDPYLAPCYLILMFVCMLLLCHVQVSEWTHTLYSLPKCQGTPCSKGAPYLKFKWQQRDSNPQTNTQSFSQTGKFG